MVAAMVAIIPEGGGTVSGTTLEIRSAVANGLIETSG
jgi:hypothetical protein